MSDADGRLSTFAEGLATFARGLSNLDGGPSDVDERPSRADDRLSTFAMPLTTFADRPSDLVPPTIDTARTISDPSMANRPFSRPL
jgi:hypothetical protein